jgi:hypothetical protein
VTIRGTAGGKPATLDVSGDTLTWRAQRDGNRDNVATTIHEVRDVAWVEQRWSKAGLGVAVLAALWTASESVVGGALLFGAAAVLLARTFARPRRQLVLACGDRRLALDVEAASAADARELASRIRRVLASGRAPTSPPTLP